MNLFTEQGSNQEIKSGMSKGSEVISKDIWSMISQICYIYLILSCYEKSGAKELSIRSIEQCQTNPSNLRTKYLTESMHIFFYLLNVFHLAINCN